MTLWALLSNTSMHTCTETGKDGARVPSRQIHRGDSVNCAFVRPRSGYSSPSLRADRLLARPHVDDRCVPDTVARFRPVTLQARMRAIRVRSRRQHTVRRALTISVYGNVGGKGTTPSSCLRCSSVSAMLSASRFARRCSGLRPPMTGKTYGVFCITYAMATVIKVGKKRKG